MPETGYTIHLRMAAENPATSEYRARVVLHDQATGERVYHELPAGPPGTESELKVSTGSSTHLYLVVAATPSNLDSPWDFRRYEYNIVPAP